MRISFVSPYFFPFLGGNETYIYNLSRGMINLGHEVEVHCVRHSKRLKKKEIKDDIEIIRHEKIFNIKTAPFYFCKPTGDIIHTFFPFPTNVYSALFSKKDRPFFLTYHNDLNDPISQVYNRTFGDVVLNSVDRIITTSPVYIKRSPILKRFRNKISIVPIGVDTKRFNPKIKSSKIRKKLKIKDKMILFVGPLTLAHTYKGVDYLIKAMKEIVKKRKKTKLVVVGDGGWRSYLMELTKNLGLTDNVIFMGRVSEEDLPKYYSACDVFILPSTTRAEGFGIVSIEAMASGKPVIGSDIGGIPFVIGDVGILTKPRDPKSIKKALLKVLNNKKLARNMGKKSLEKVKKNFSLEMFAKNMLKVYEPFI